MTEAELMMRGATKGGCCPRHVAIGSHQIPPEKRHPADGPCGPLTLEDIGCMAEVAYEALGSTDPGAYARGALRANLVLCATLAGVMSGDIRKRASMRRALGEPLTDAESAALAEAGQ